MKLLGAPLIGIGGMIVFGILGLVPLAGPATPVDSTSDQVTVEKPSLQLRSDDSTRSVALLPEASNESSGQPVEGSSVETALRRKVDMLNRGRAFLQGVEDYTFKLQKQEVVRGELLDEQIISVKCRHKPFSVYLLWITADPGREVIYIEGQNNGKMIAHDGGWKARIPAFTLATDGIMAMRDARYPVTTAGIMNFIEQMLEVHNIDLEQANYLSCDVDTSQTFGERACDVYTTLYKSATDSPEYRKSITFIDREWNIPVYSRHFEWPRPGLKIHEEELDQATLTESYSFTEIDFDCEVTDHDFNRSNKEYRFR